MSSVSRMFSESRLARAVTVFVIQAILVTAAIALCVIAILMDRAGLRARDYVRFESHARLVHRVTLAAAILMLIDVALAFPIAGAILIVAAVAWTAWWLPASHRRLDVTAEAVFDVPPEAVAAVMFDISQQPRWIDSIVQAVLVTPGLVRVGSVVKQTIRLSGHELVATLVVTDFVPYERLVLTVELERAKPFDRYEVASHARGALVRSMGHHEISLVNAILSGWGVPALRKRFAERRAANLERLKEIVSGAARRPLRIV
jgi:hypothetical protein